MPNGEVPIVSAPAIDTSDLIKTVGDNRAPGPLRVSEVGWEERLRLAAGETLQRRAVRAAARSEFARRRAHGMVDRQAQRLSRVRGSAPPVP
jgi:hypothetical protein